LSAQAFKDGPLTLGWAAHGLTQAQKDNLINGQADVVNVSQTDLDINGTFRWTFDTTAHAVACLAAADLNGDGREEIAIGTVYFCVPAATADGGRLWQDEDYNDYWRAGPVFAHLGIGDVDGDGALEVVTVGADSLIHCISCQGEKKWTCSIGDEAAGLVLHQGLIIAASLTGDVHAVDGRGNGLWRTDLGKPCTAMAKAGDALCVAVEGGDLFRLTGKGEVTSRTSLPTPVTRLLGRNNGDVIAATAEGLVGISL